VRPSRLSAFLLLPLGANAVGFTVQLLPAFGTVLAIPFVGERTRLAIHAASRSAARAAPTFAIPLPAISLRRSGCFWPTSLPLFQGVFCTAIGLETSMARLLEMESH
jgi:hypothetical protein